MYTPAIVTGATIPTLSDNPGQVIARQLGSNERILWSGKPRQGLFIHRSDPGNAIFGAVWLVGTLFMELEIIVNQLPWYAAVGVLPFIYIGAYWTIGCYWLQARRRRNTFYGVTDRRIMIVSGDSRDEMQSLDLRNLPALSLVDGEEGYGTIYFGDHSQWNPDGIGWPLDKDPPFLQFDTIENARHVHEIIRSAQARARGDSHSPAA